MYELVQQQVKVFLIYKCPVLIKFSCHTNPTNNTSYLSAATKSSQLPY